MRWLAAEGMFSWRSQQDDWSSWAEPPSGPASQEAEHAHDRPRVGGELAGGLASTARTHGLPAACFFS